MKLFRVLVLLVLAFVCATACADVPVDDERSDRRLLEPRGAIRGTVFYEGPAPCSRSGHIVGSAIVLVFDRRKPPPPEGLGRPVSFVAVPGDVLFPNQPRSVDPDLFCPSETQPVSTSAPYAIGPLDAGSYVMAAFYDRRGRFVPSFGVRNAPEAGDITGGYLDLEDAMQHQDELDYEPRFRAVEVGFPQRAEGREIPDYDLGPSGFVAEGIPVSLRRRMPLTRPYFYPRNPAADAPELATPDGLGAPQVSPTNPLGDPFAVPILSITQDHPLRAPASTPSPETLSAYQASFPSLEFVWGVPEKERDVATDLSGPFGFQLPALPPADKGGLLVFLRRGAKVPGTDIPALWPKVVLVKLASLRDRQADPQSLVVQGTSDETRITGKPPGPLVLLDGITLFDDSLAKTVSGAPPGPSTAALRDHVTALVRPAALCLDSARPDQPGVLVTPHLVGQSADPAETGERPLFDASRIGSDPRVREFRRGCLPTGRYGLALVYPTGQAWSVPNEAGGCALAEGTVSVNGRIASCTEKPRPVLLSQGARAVVEIVGPSEEGLASKVCESNPVPAECLAP
jgi:hypothetical protein